MKSDDVDILVMRISTDDGKTRYTADVQAEYDGKNSAMALTTGGMAALASRVIMTEKFGENGVFPLENVIKAEPELMANFIEGLRMLGVLNSQSKSDLI